MRRTTRCLALAVLLTLATACSSSSSDDGSSPANAAGSEESAGGEDAAGTSAADLTTEQCEALQAVEPDDIDSVADQLPEQLVDELRRYAEELEAWQAEGTDPTTPQPTPGDELQAAYDHCVELLDLGEVPDAGEAFFGYHSMQITGDTAVVTVAGSCRDGSIPTDVEMSLPLGGTVPGTDVGAGNFEFTVDVTDTADEEGLIAELGLDADTIDLTVSGTCG